MKVRKLDYHQLIKQFDKYEENFAQNVQDPYLVEFFNGFEDSIKISNFSTEQLLEVRTRLERLMKMFADKKLELKNQSSEALATRDKLQRYITNSHIGK